MKQDTKERLLETGLGMLLQHGYNDLGVQALLQETQTPKGSFYHHFRSKEDFALQVIDRYMADVHKGLELSLGNSALTPLGRVRRFFELSRDKYRQEGYLGCLLGGVGQELSGVNEVFRHRIEECFQIIAAHLATCLEEARRQGELPPDRDPGALADLLVDCWEGAALRSRLRGDPEPLETMLDFYFSALSRS